ncbi:MAG: GGDEF domain-containing protein [Butyrivibrio sp.]|nr:GGDEF domain-containing protein [Butyrivibrio sp.]
MNLVAVATSDYIGVLLLVAMLVSSRIRRSDSEHPEVRLFSIITMLTLAACIVDFMVFYVDGKPGLSMKVINMLGNTYCFIANPVFISSWCIYADLRLYHSKSRIRKYYKYAMIPAAIMVLIAVLNIFVPMIYYIDEQNIYHRLPLSYVYYMVDAGYLLFSIYILKGYEKRYGKVRFFPMYLMVTPIILGCTFQAIFYGISLIWVSLAVGLTSMYMSLQNESSYLDRLTGLYNRAYFDYQLDAAIKDPGGKTGAIMIDVDYFKQINDTYGHSAGDEALIDVARVIQLSKPDKVVAIRFAGDEFILLVRNTSDRQMQSIIDSIRDEVNVFNETENRQYKLSLSLGYAIYEPGKDTVDDFLKRMDDNMYDEKNQKHAKR